jgi:hypothetical protein
MVSSAETATRGRSATEGGDEQAGVKSVHPFEHQLANARSQRRDQGRVRASMTTMRRSSACAATRGRSATEGSNEGIGYEERAIRSRSSLANRIGRWDRRLVGGRATDGGGCANAGNDAQGDIVVGD